MPALSQVEPIHVDWENLKGEEWERLPGETPKAYHAFGVYRGLGVMERSYTTLGKQIGRSPLGIIREWSKRYHWRRRIDAWDDHNDRQALIEQRQAIAEMNDRHARTAMTMLNAVARRLVGDDREGQEVKAIDPGTLSAQDVARLAEVATKIERLSRGEESERLGLTGTESAPPEVKIAFLTEPYYPPAQALEEVALPVIDQKPRTRELTSGTEPFDQSLPERHPQRYEPDEKPAPSEDPDGSGLTEPPESA